VASYRLTEGERDRIVASIRSGDRPALARAITLIESTRADHRRAATRLLEAFAPAAGNAIRLGVSGAPGVGKSTFIEALGLRAIDAGHRVAVLTIDPSSELGGGSILGDKTRMETLSRRPEAFIRPSPSGGKTGGVARRTREAMLLCEVAGFDFVVVETVGVGQSETAVAQMTDMFLVLLSPGGGDELQGMKRGIVELADLLLVNKADGEMAGPAERTVAEYRNALRLLRPRTSRWSPVVASCSALTGTGIGEAWEAIVAYREGLDKDDTLAARRATRAREWLWEEISENLLARLRSHPEVKRRIAKLEAAVSGGALPPPIAADELLEAFLSAPRKGEE